MSTGQWTLDTGYICIKLRDNLRSLLPKKPDTDDDKGAEYTNKNNVFHLLSITYLFDICTQIFFHFGILETKIELGFDKLKFVAAIKDLSP